MSGITQERLINMTDAAKALKDILTRLLSDLKSHPHNAINLQSTYELETILLLNKYLATIEREDAHFRAWGKKNAQNKRRRNMARLIRDERRIESTIPMLPIKDTKSIVAGASLAEINAGLDYCAEVKNFDEMERLMDLQVAHPDYKR